MTAIITTTNERTIFGNKEGEDWFEVLEPPIVVPSTQEVQNYIRYGSAEPEPEGLRDFIDRVVCVECSTEILRNSREHDNCKTKNGEDWYCIDCDIPEEYECVECSTIVKSFAGYGAHSRGLCENCLDDFLEPEDEDPECCEEPDWVPTPSCVCCGDQLMTLRDYDLSAIGLVGCGKVKVCFPCGRKLTRNGIQKSS